MIWRLVFLILYVIFFLIRSSYGSRQRYTAEPVKYLENLKAAREREGGVSMTLRSILSATMLLSIVVYGINPAWILNFTLPIPLWLRLIGLSLALITLPLLYWAHSSLGSQYSPDLDLKDDHKLITSGPYKIIRHPMYSILLTFMIGISLVSASSLILVPHMAAILLILLRLNKEEDMLIKEFGEDYREYMLKTGRLLPKFN